MMTIFSVLLFLVFDGKGEESTVVVNIAIPLLGVIVKDYRH